MLNHVIAPHLSGYQRRDYDVVDYRMSELPETGLQFRGPFPERFSGGQIGGTEEPYVCCVGAAQTFGCFTESPFPTLLADRLNVPVLNLGYGGAGPEFFLGQSQLSPYLNRSKIVVLQVMSGRSQSNSLYECGGLEYVTRRSDGRRMGAQQAIAEALFPGPAHIGPVRIPTRLRGLAPNNPQRVRSRIGPLIDEIRSNWVESYRSLIRRLDVPVVLFWFSKRAPNYVESYESAAGIFGQFPQLVTAEMVEQVRSMCDDYVECVTDRGSPQPLVSRFTGEPVEVNPANDRRDLGHGVWSENRYYPSPEMHQDAAAALVDVLESRLGREVDST